MTLLPLSPYVVGRPAKETEFVGRLVLLAGIERCLANPHDRQVVVQGQRRVGKSSVLHRLREKLPRDRFLPVYFDIHHRAKENLGQLLGDLARKIAREMKLPPPDKDRFDDRGEYFLDTFLVEVESRLGPQCRLVLLLDEFDGMGDVEQDSLPPSSAARSLFPFLYALLDEDAFRVAIVYAVGRDAVEPSADLKSLMRGAHEVSVGVLGEGDARALILRGQDLQLFEFEEGGIEHILHLGGRLPLALQILCSRLYDLAALHPGHPLKVTAETVEGCVDAAITAHCANFEWWWDGLSPEEQVFCAGLATASVDGRRAGRDEVAQTLAACAPRLRDSELIAMALDRLERRQVVDEDDQGFRFHIELIRRWIVGHRSVRQAAAALDRRIPVAVRFYELGRKALDQRQIPLAIQHLQECLAEDPRHYQARVSIAEALLRNGEFERAWEEAERAYDDDPRDGRTILIQAGAARARSRLSVEDPGLQRRSLFEAHEQISRLRQIAPDDPEVEELFKRLENLLTPLGDAEPSLTYGIEPTPRRESDAARELRDRLSILFVGDRAIYGPYLEILEGGEEQVKRTLYRFEAVTLDYKPVSLQVFAQLSSFGGRLWESATHALVQMSQREHAALPRILDGGYYEREEDESFAFVITESAEGTLASPEALANLRGERDVAFQHFFRLTEALSLLHEQGIIHRNVWPGAVERVPLPETRIAGKESLRLARFEMSVLITSLLQSLSRDGRDRDGRDDARDFYLNQGALGLLCAPPERLAYLFYNAPGWEAHVGGHLEDHRSDVYGLGMVAFQLFVGPLPADGARALFESGQPDWAGFESLHREIRAQITRARLPKLLIDLMHQMIDLDQRARPRSDEVRATLHANYNGLMDAWRPYKTEKPFLLGVIPEDTGRELYFKGGLSERNGNDQGPGSTDRPGLSAWVADEVGMLELLDVIQDDLKAGRLTYSERGFSPYVRGPTEQTDGARYVLYGKDYVWFAVPFEHRGHRTTKVPQALLIKYVLERAIYRPPTDALYRQLPNLEVLPWRAPALRPDQAANRPLWTPLLESVTLSGAMRPWHQIVFDALGWLLRYHRVQLDARVYPFIRREGGARSAEVVLQYDPDRDQRHLNHNAMLSLYARSERRRPQFTEFFVGAFDDDDSTGELLVYPDRDGRPDLSVRKQVKVHFSGMRGGDAIAVRRDPKEGPEFPEHGWIQPDGDFATAALIRHQERALLDLLGMHTLLDQLEKPRSLRRPMPPLELDLSKLRGKAPETVRAMITARPFFALHGPPGTGKTTVATLAIHGRLEGNRNSRVLVSAQSHYALDNIAEKLVDSLSDYKHLTYVRVTSADGEAKVSRQMRGYLPNELATQSLRRIEGSCKERIEGGQEQGSRLALLKRWQKTAPQSLVEIRERLERGANLVFATCGTATPERLTLAGRYEGFDTVLVEEAAKAWPTELIMPLVRGRQWILIGDHHQLGAFQRDEVIEFLHDCDQSSDQQLYQAAGSAERYIEVFDLFRRLIETHQSGQVPAALSHLLQDSVGRLQLQFRMRRPIGELVSRAFYDGKLGTDACTETPPTDERKRPLPVLERPRPVAANALLWVDMGDRGKEVPCWWNQQELEVVTEIAARLVDVHGRPLAAERIAILAPYREQVARLERRFLAHDRQDLAARVRTVDSFQGKEAEIVLVSLVRFNDVDPEDRPRGRLGHMAKEQRLNVMLSRARRHLVLVGSFDFFRDSKVPHWDVICNTVTELGERIPIEGILPKLELT